MLIILLAWSYCDGISQANDYLQNHFIVKDTVKRKYVLDIEFVCPSKHDGITLMQKCIELASRKLSFGQQTIIYCPLITGENIWNDDSFVLDDANQHFMTTENFIYKFATHLDISFICRLLS